MTQRDIDFVFFSAVLCLCCVAFGTFMGAMLEKDKWERDIISGKVTLKTQVTTNIVVEVEAK